MLRCSFPYILAQTRRQTGEKQIGSLQAAKILTRIFCVNFAFHAILSYFRKIVQKNFFGTFFESCLELHETQSKHKKSNQNFCPL